MGTKADQKKEYIRRTAREVFARKGFKDVTMKDIVDACKISRGGLYLYYESTEDIFQDIIDLPEDLPARRIAEMEKAGLSAERIIRDILSMQRKAILGGGHTLDKAMAEYSFLHPGTVPMRRKFEELEKALEGVIAQGIAEENFSVRDPYAAALNLTLILMGLKITARTVGLTAEEFDREELTMLHSLGIRKQPG